MTNPPTSEDARLQRLREPFVVIQICREDIADVIAGRVAPEYAAAHPDLPPDSSYKLAEAIPDGEMAWFARRLFDAYAPGLWDDLANLWEIRLDRGAKGV
jgi:hypothetical protein